MRAINTYKILKVIREVCGNKGQVFLCRAEWPELRGMPNWRTMLHKTEEELIKEACSGSTIILVILNDSCETRRKHIAAKIHGIRAPLYKTDGRS